MHDPFYDLFPRPALAPWPVGQIALVTIDMQYLDAHRDGWLGRIAKAKGMERLLDERFRAIDATVPNIRRLQQAFRAAQQEVIHARLAYRKKDARDAGTAYLPSPEASPLPRNKRDEALLDEVCALDDEMIFSKVSSSIFSSTDIDQVLRRMRITHLALTGLTTDGCVELSARDAADRGYSVTLVSDGCCASTLAAHEDAIQRMTDGGFVSARTTDEAVILVTALKSEAN